MNKIEGTLARRWARILPLVVVLLGVEMLGSASAQRQRMLVDPGAARSLTVESMVEQLQKGSIVVEPVTPMQAPPAASPDSGEGESTLLLSALLFDFDSAVLTPQVRQTLVQVAQAMNDPRMSGQRFLLEGHADYTGGWDHNRRLSQRRADAVAQELIRLGVARDRLMIVGYSWNRLLLDIPQVDPRHRRVEIGRLR